MFFFKLFYILFYLVIFLEVYFFISLFIYVCLYLYFSLFFEIGEYRQTLVDLNAAVEDNNRLKIALLSLEDECNKYATEQSKLETLLERKKLEYEQLFSTHEEMETELNTLKNEYRENTKALAIYQKKAKSLETSMDTLKKELLHIQGVKITLETKLNDTVRDSSVEIDNLSNVVDSLREELHNVSDQLRDARRDLLEMRNNLEREERRSLEVNKKLTESIERENEKDLSIDKMKKELLESSNRVMTLESLNVDLEAQIKAYNDKEIALSLAARAELSSGEGKRYVVKKNRRKSSLEGGAETGFDDSHLPEVEPGPNDEYIDVDGLVVVDGDAPHSNSNNPTKRKVVKYSRRTSSTGRNNSVTTTTGFYEGDEESDDSLADVIYKLLVNKMGTKDAGLARDAIAPVLKTYTGALATTTKVRFFSMM